MAHSTDRIRVILGTMTIGPRGQTDAAVAQTQLQLLAGCNEAKVKATTPGEVVGKVLVDTARVYQNGETETLLGEVFRNMGTMDDYCIHTKVNASISPLDASGVRDQLGASLAALGVAKVQLLYVHFPNIDVSIEETFGALDALHKEGKFEELGLSNYSAWDVMRVSQICKERGWVAPTVYQGMYNCITRSVEGELLPALRHLGMRFYAYNPLAGGMLTGKYTSMDDERPEKSRFSETYGGSKGKTSSNTMYQARYWKREIFAALGVLRAACEAEGVAMSDAAIRWCVHHSKLSAKHGDGIIIGASQLQHCEANLEAFQGAPLSEAILNALHEANRIAYADAELYFRGYGPTPGDSSRFLSKF